MGVCVLTAKCQWIYTSEVIRTLVAFFFFKGMAASLEQAMFVCQLDSRECQEVTERRLVCKWLPVSQGKNSPLWRSPPVPEVLLPSVWLEARGWGWGQVRLVQILPWNYSVGVTYYLLPINTGLLRTQPCNLSQLNISVCKYRRFCICTE